MPSSNGIRERYAKIPVQVSASTNNANSSSRRQRQSSPASPTRTDSPPVPSKRSRHVDNRRAADTITLEQLRHTLDRTEASGGRHQDDHHHPHDHYHHHYHEPHDAHEDRESRHQRQIEADDPSQRKCEILQGAIRHIERAEQEAAQRRRQLAIDAEMKKPRRQSMVVLPRSSERSAVESSAPALAYRTRVR